MFINNGNESYPEKQKNKLIAFLKDFRNRHPKIDLKINLLGLGEVATEVRKVPLGEGKIFPRHEAPGKIFWEELAEELAKLGFGLFLQTEAKDKAQICISPDSSKEEILALQEDLQKYGYAIEASGIYDAATKAWVTRFNQRYVPDAAQQLDANLWSKASQLSLEYIQHYINAKTNTQSASSRGSFFNQASNFPEANTVQTLTLNK